MTKEKILNAAMFAGFPVDIFFKLENALNDTVTEAELKSALADLGAAHWYSQIQGLLSF